MLRGARELELVRQAFGSIGWERHGVDSQLVGDQDNALGVGIVDIDPLLDAAGEIRAGSIQKVSVGLVETGDGMRGIAGTLMDVPHFLRVPDEVRIGRRGETPLLDQPRLSRVLVSVRRTISYEMKGTTSSRITSCVSRRMDQWSGRPEPPNGQGRSVSLLARHGACVRRRDRGVCTHRLRSARQSRTGDEPAAPC